MYTATLSGHASGPGLGVGAFGNALAPPPSPLPEPEPPPWIEIEPTGNGLPSFHEPYPKGRRTLSDVAGIPLWLIAGILVLLTFRKGR